MALKPTIYKFSVVLSDLDRNYYDTLNLTVAQHPSESIERMMARILAFSLNAQEELSFTKGLSTPEEPDIWQKSLDGQLIQWIDVGEPSFERIKKASHLAKYTSVYSFNSKSEVWWQQSQEAFSELLVNVRRFPWEGIQRLAKDVTRTMELSITVSESSLFISWDGGDIEIPCISLQSH